VIYTKVTIYPYLILTEILWGVMKFILTVIILCGITTFCYCENSVIERDFELGDSGIFMTMVWIPAGSFMMGALPGEMDAESDEYPRHKVTISEGFWMGKYELTQGQWEGVMGKHKSYIKGEENFPAFFISWEKMTNIFLPKLGTEWRLPTEAEWEYACRAGNDSSMFWWGNGLDELDEYTWINYNHNKGNIKYNKHNLTKEVGGKKPNPWGLYDMIDNLFEYCSDYYRGNYYSMSADIDPRESSSEGLSKRGFDCYSRVRRGGTTVNGSNFRRSASRSYGPEAVGTSCDGFRLVREGD
jgi:formylglycine-generating enzyme required for sulfatase activity